jgi:hypothetical protein
MRHENIFQQLNEARKIGRDFINGCWSSGFSLRLKAS